MENNDASHSDDQLSSSKQVSLGFCQHYRWIIAAIMLACAVAIIIWPSRLFGNVTVAVRYTELYDVRRISVFLRQYYGIRAPQMFSINIMLGAFVGVAVPVACAVASAVMYISRKSVGRAENVCVLLFVLSQLFYTVTVCPFYGIWTLPVGGIVSFIGVATVIVLYVLFLSKESGESVNRLISCLLPVVTIFFLVGPFIVYNRQGNMSILVAAERIGYRFETVFGWRSGWLLIVYYQNIAALLSVIVVLQFAGVRRHIVRPVLYVTVMLQLLTVCGSVIYFTVTEKFVKCTIGWGAAMSVICVAACIVWEFLQALRHSVRKIIDLSPDDDKSICGRRRFGAAKRRFCRLTAR